MNSFITHQGTVFETSLFKCRLWRSRVAYSEFDGSLGEVVRIMNRTGDFPKNCSNTKLESGMIDINEWENLWRVGPMPVYPIDTFMWKVQKRTLEVCNNWLRWRITPTFSIVRDVPQRNGWGHDFDNEKILISERRYEIALMQDPVRAYIREALVMEYTKSRMNLDLLAETFIQEEARTRTLLNRIKLNPTDFSLKPEVLRLARLAHPDNDTVKLPDTYMFYPDAVEVYVDVAMILGLYEDMVSRWLPEYLYNPILFAK